MSIRKITRVVPFCLKINKVTGLPGVTSAPNYQIFRHESDSSLDSSAPKPVPFHRTTPWDKKCLVWTSRYKSVAEVPDMVTPSAILKARDKMRVIVSLIMIGGAAIVCYCGVLWGKYDKKRGRTISIIAEEYKQSQIEKYHPKEK